MSRIPLPGKPGPGRPRNCDKFAGCPDVQYCKVQAQCKQACEDNSQACEDGKCLADQRKAMVFVPRRREVL